MDSVEEIREYARRNSVPVMFDETADFICRYIKENNVKTVLEIGSAIGYSAIRFAQSGAKVVTVELDIDRYSRACDNIRDCGLQHMIEIYNADALTFTTDKKFDLIFIDAAKAQYIKFFERFEQNLAEGGVFISDNLFFHGMVGDPSLTHNYSTIKLVRKIRKYVGYLKTNVNYDTVFYSLGDGIAVTRKNRNPVERDADFILAVSYKKGKDALYVTQFPPKAECEQNLAQCRHLMQELKLRAKELGFTIIQANAKKDSLLEKRLLELGFIHAKENHDDWLMEFGM